jgi:hypothetical protein
MIGARLVGAGRYQTCGSAAAFPVLDSKFRTPV